MSVRLAVDVGCTTVVAAAGDGAATDLLEFEGEDGPAGTLTASLVVRADGSARVGSEADRVLDGAPHDGARGPLAHLGSGAAVLELAAGPVPVVALVGELLARPLRVLERGAGAPPAEAVLTIPAGWPADGRRGRALRAAAALAGLPPATLVPAAAAAAELTRSADSETVLVCDVGGRTTQVTLVGLEPAAQRLLATTELAVGADLFDEMLYVDVLRLLEELDEAAAARLEEQHLLSAEAGSAPDAAAWAACQAELARGVRRAREGLAAAPSWTLEIGAPVERSLELAADRLAALLETELQIVAAAAREQVAQSDAGIGRAVLVGGGASAPGLRAALAAELDLAVELAADPVTAVARGALLVAARAGTAQPARAPAGGTRRPARAAAPPPAAPRAVLDDVAAAAVAGDELVAVVRHDGHQRLVRIDGGGRVVAAHGVAGSDVLALAETAAAVVVASAVQAALLTPDLRPLATVARPVLAAADGTCAWIAASDGEQAPALALTTLAMQGRRAARTVDEQRLGPAPVARRGLRAGARSARPSPPVALWAAGGGRLRFALAARGRGGRPVQLVADATAAGLGEVATRPHGPPWVVGLLPGGATLTGGGGTATRLALADRELASWPAAVRVALLAGPGGWLVAARQETWEAFALAGGELQAVRAGDGRVEQAVADAGELWLVCERGGERRLARLGADGDLERVATLAGPLEPLGRIGGELLALAGPAGAPRALVALSATRR